MYVSLFARILISSTFFSLCRKMFIKQPLAYRFERLNYQMKQDALDKVRIMNQNSSISYIVYWPLISNMNILQIKHYSWGGGGGGGRTALDITYKSLSNM